MCHVAHYNEYRGLPMTKKPTYEELEQKIKKLEKCAVEQKETEESLRREKNFSESIIDSLPGIFYFFNEAGELQRWNKNFEKVSGYSANEIAVMNPLDFFEGQDKEKVAARIADVLDKGQSSVEADFVSKSGSKTPYYLTGMRLEFGGNLYLAGMGIDVSQRARAEKALLESEAQYRSFFENNHAVMLLINPESAAIVDANPAAYAYYGYPKDVITTMKITDINTRSEKEVFEEMHEAKTENRSYFNFQHRLSNGEDREVEVYSGPITVRNKPLLYSVIHDITERRLASAERERLITKLQEALAEVKNTSRFPTHLCEL